MTDTLKEPFRERMTKQLAEILGAAVPVVFADTDRIYVLKIGIREDLLTRYPAADPDRLSRWLGEWTGKRTYLSAIKRHAHRIDLDGNEAGRISHDARKRANWRLKRLKPKAQPSDDRSAPCTSPEGHVIQTEGATP